MKKHLLLTLLTLAFISCDEEIPVYTVTVSSSPSEGGSVSPQGGEYQQGQTASFTATPNEFYGFAGWSGADTSTINPVSIIVDANKSLTARFEKLDTDNDGITDDIDECPDTPANEQADSNGCSVSQKDFELTISVEGEGTVTEEVVVAPTIYQGTTQVQLTAVPAEGWEFTEWTGNATGTDNPITIEIDGTKNITVVFTKKDTDGDGIPDLEDSCADTPSGEEADENGCSLSQKEFELTVTTEGEGAVTEELIVSPTIYQGTSQVKLTAVPAEGWEFTEWTGDVTGAENPVTIEIDGAKSVTVVFTKKDTDGDGVPDLEDQDNNTRDGVPVDENGVMLNPIYLDDNEITVKAQEWGIPGDSGEIDDVNYTIVDETTLREMVADDKDVTKVVTTRITDMSKLFQDKLSFNQNIASWDTSSVTSMRAMFYGESEMLFDKPIGEWNVSKVTDMGEMFVRARTFNQDISKWNVSKVTDMSGMFLQAWKFNQNIGEWDVSNVIDMNAMFQDAHAFNQDIGSWSVLNVTDMGAMFVQAFEFNQDISSWNVSKVTDMSGMFFQARKFNQDIGEWDVSNVEDMQYMFKGAEKFNQDLNLWDVSKVKNMNHMFHLDNNVVGSFNGDITNWDTSNVEHMDHMFFEQDNFNQDISGWNVSNVKTMHYMFREADSFNQDLSSWNVGSVTNMMGMFTYTDSFNGDLASWNTSSVINFSYMFEASVAFNGDVTGWDTSNAIDMRNMFSGAAAFNQNLNSWNTASVINMAQMFKNASAFSGSISGWDVEKVTNFSQTFMNADAFNSDISDWNTISAENMSSMFANTDIFNQDISNWNVSNVTNMNQMFGNADGFNIDIGDWNVSNVTNMDYMFRFADVFNQDISAWCVSNFDEEPTSFKSGSPLTDANSPVWGTCPPNANDVTLSRYSESKSCVNGVCDVNLGLRLSNNSEETISVSKIEKWVNDSLITTYTSGDMIGDLTSGASKGFGITLNSATTGQIKVFWSYGDKNYTVVYDWTP